MGSSHTYCASRGIIASENVKIDNITYQPMDWYGGYVFLTGAGASLNNLTAPKNCEEVVLEGSSGGSISAANVSVGWRPRMSAAKIKKKKKNNLKNRFSRAIISLCIVILSNICI